MTDNERTIYRPELIYKKPAENFRSHVARLNNTFKEASIKSEIGFVGLLTAGVELATFALGAREANQVTAEEILGLGGSIATVIEFSRVLMQRRSLRKFILQTPELHILNPN